MDVGSKEEWLLVCAGVCVTVAITDTKNYTSVSFLLGKTKLDCVLSQENIAV